ncbi:MAG: trigger factor, partial [Pseudomonadota bacterium]
MQVTETLNEGLKRGYTITITGAELDEKVDAKLEEARPQIEMKGFRKGKVPKALLKKQFGDRMMGEVMQEAVDGAMQSHFEETGDKPALQPKIEMQGGETWKAGDDVVVDMSYEALPEIPEVALGDIALERMKVAPDDASVDEALGELAKNAKTFAAKDGAAEEGDQVVMDFVGRVDGEEFDGGAAEDFPLEIGSGQFIPGFEPQLVGVKGGEEKVVEVSFPEDYQAPNLAGKAAEFTCTIKEVKAPAEAEIDDELAKRFGAEDLDGLKGQIRERLEAEYQGAARQVMKRGLLDKLDDIVSFDL